MFGIQITKVCKVISIIALLIMQAACGGGGGGENPLPQERPDTKISGSVFVSGAMSSTDIKVYQLTDGDKGELLASTKTDKSGEFEVSINASGAIIIEASGGSYRETASNKVVSVKGAQAISAIIYLQGEDEQNIAITPFTTMIHALAEYSIKQGTDVKTAIDNAKSKYNQLFGVDLSTIIPTDIRDERSSRGFADEEAYGFWEAALSSWMLAVSEKNSTEPHTYYNGIYAAGLIYRDISSDGVWDGKALSLSSNSTVNLTFGVVSLDSQVYRRYLAQHLLKAAGSDYNHTIYRGRDLLSVANDFSQNTDELFGNLEPLTIDEEGPEITREDDAPVFFSEEAVFECKVTDVVGIDYVNVFLNSEQIAFLEPTESKVSVSIDTEDYADGKYDLEVVAVDAVGNQSSETYTITINNNSSTIEVTSSGDTNVTPYTVTGIYTENGPAVQTITVAGVEADINQTASTWSAEISLVNGINEIKIVYKDELDQEEEFDTVINLDQIAPVIDVSSGHSNVSVYSDGEIYSDVLGDINSGKVIYIDAETSRLNSAPVSKEALDNAGLPYFFFSTYDDYDNDVRTDVDDLKVTYSYSLGSEEIFADKALTMTVSGTGEYLIPIVEEYFDNNWDQSETSQTHKIVVTASDKAGNSTTKEFSFKAFFDGKKITINSDVIEGTAKIYSWNAGIRGELIEECQTDSDGNCQVTLLSSKAPLLIEITGGKYREPYDGTQVILGNGDSLNAVLYFNCEDKTVQVNPLTHIVAAYAENLADKGDNAEDAIANANQKLSSVYGFDVAETVPAAVATPAAEDELSDVYKYSFVLAGISGIGSSIATENSNADQSIYNSITFAKEMAADISDDGLLNGNVSMGVSEIDQDTYRNLLADNMMAFVNSSENKTLLDVEDALEYLQFIAESEDEIFAGAEVTPFDVVAPVVQAANFEENGYFSGSVDFSFEITEKSKLSSIEFFIDGISKGKSEVTLTPTIQINTAGYTYGQHTISLKATDILGNSSTTTFNVSFDNTKVEFYSFGNGSTISLYTLNGVVKRDFVASCTTNSSGYCSMSPATNRQTLIAVLSGGSYYETGSGNSFEIGGQELTTVFNYNAQDMAISITPVTHAATGIFTKLVDSDNQIPSVAAQNANGILSTLYGFDIQHTKTIDIDSEVITETDDSAKYAFLLAGISSWINQVAENNGAANQQYYNSILFAEKMYSDLEADGTLDGDFSIGDKQLTQTVYRNEIADSILAEVNGERNSTGLSIEELLPFVVSIAESDNSIYSGAGIVPFDNDAPVIETDNFTTGDYINGTKSFTFAIEDKTGAKEISFDIDGISLGEAGDLSNPAITVDTSGYAYGSYELGINVVDHNNNSSYQQFQINFDNSVITIKTLNKSSTVSVYKWNGSRGDLVTECTTDTAGICNLMPTTARQNLEVVVSGGKYSESTSGADISMSGRTLRSIFKYNGASSSVSVTPITHIMAAYTEKLNQAGADYDSARQLGETDFGNLYGFNPITTAPYNISIGTETTEVADSDSYAFILAGISQWTYDAAITNGVSNQGNYNSVLFAHWVAEDIKADLKLNGGYSFGTVPLGVSVYRNGIADAMLKITNSDKNNTDYTVSDILTTMQNVAESTHELYDGAAVTAFDDQGAEVTPLNFTEGEKVSGIVDLSFTITDKTGISSVAFDVAGDDKGAGDTSNPVLNLDTSGLDNGVYKIGVNIVDIAGNTSYTQFDIEVTN